MDNKLQGNCYESKMHKAKLTKRIETSAEVAPTHVSQIWVRRQNHFSLKGKAIPVSSVYHAYNNHEKKKNMQKWYFSLCEGPCFYTVSACQNSQALNASFFFFWHVFQTATRNVPGCFPEQTPENPSQNHFSYFCCCYRGFFLFSVVFQSLLLL